MGADDSLLAALEASLAALPPDSDAADRLRVHMAGQYLSAGRAGRALELCDTVLERSPTDDAALAVASAAAAAAGDGERADQLRDQQARRLGEFDLVEPVTLPPSPDPLGETEWPSDPDRVTFADVHGMDDVKQRLRRSLVGPLRNAALAEAFRKNLRGGLLMWGPPGSGKTFIARAVAGELDATFISATPADIFDPYFGGSENNVARVFAKARAQRPSVVFFDEIDAIGGKRSMRHTDQGRGVVNQLLTELDGMTSNAGVFLLAATNAPWDVDEALRRPGRFDRTVLVLPPDPESRRGILRGELAERPTSPDLDIDAVVKRTEGYTGADLLHVVNVATERALERSIDSGVTCPVTNSDLSAGLADTPPSARPWFSHAATYAAYANARGDYDDLLSYMRRHRLT